MKMTDEDVLRLAQEAGFPVNVAAYGSPTWLFHARRFAQLCYQQGALDMRERCAKACEKRATMEFPQTGELLGYVIGEKWRSARDADASCAYAIRALTVGET